LYNLSVGGAEATQNGFWGRDTGNIAT